MMQRWWSAFDELHATQAPGMPSLWGLVEDGVSWLDDGSGPYRSGLYDELLPADLNGDIERLWDGTTIARWPERIVSEPWPHRAMADAFGPAVNTWRLKVTENNVGITRYQLQARSRRSWRKRRASTGISPARPGISRSKGGRST